MALVNKWWISCVLSLFCTTFFGSGNTYAEAYRTPPEPPIFNELCAMKEQVGPCKAIKDRFFFDIDAGRCQQFEYGGCGGNANNFETLEACEETCVVSADKSPCHLGEAPGPCRGLVTRYFFDSESQECKHFFYGGCFGNANNFRSMAECQAKCQNPVNTTKAPEVFSAQPTRKSSVQPLKVTEDLIPPQVYLHTHHQPTDFNMPEFCLTPVDRGTCDGAERKFAYDHRNKRCHMFHYSGCGGNSNNFSHRRQCMKTCMNIRSRNNGKKMIRIRKKNLNNILFRSV